MATILRFRIAFRDPTGAGEALPPPHPLRDIWSQMKRDPDLSSFGRKYPGGR